jgi:hypothetical protein
MLVISIVMINVISDAKKAILISLSLKATPIYENTTIIIAVGIP